MRRSHLVFGIAVIALGAATSRAEDVQATRLEVVMSPGSSVHLEGDSTLHRYSSKSSDLRVTALAELAAAVEPIAVEVVGLGRLVQLEVRVPVNSLKSGSGGLDANMYAALKEPSHPEIVFRLEDYETTANAAAPGTYRVKASGRLTVAGSERVVTLTGIARAEKGALRVQGGAATGRELAKNERKKS
jgi:hypothetical protein